MTDTTATPIPAGIESPDEVHTRLGTLRFFDGFPDDATVRTLFDNLDFQRAVQAYLLALPALNMAAMRSALLEWGPVNSTAYVFEDLMHPRTVWLTANTSTSYTAIWIDLRDGPLVIEAPPGVLGAIDDSWGRWVVDVGLTGPDKGRGGAYLLLPPGYDGEVPGGYFVVRTNSFGMVLFVRGFLDEHGDPHPAVEVIKDKTRAYPLALADRPPSMRFVNVSPEPMVGVPPADFRAWEMLDEVVQSEPPESSDPLTLGFFASIGIRRGTPFDPDERMRAILTEAAAVGDATGRALTYRFRQPEAYRYPGSTWRAFFLGGHRFEEDGVALLDAAAQFNFSVTGVSPAEDVERIGTGSQYVVACVDADGAPFDGGRTYRLRVPANVPAGDFWSILAYDTQTRSMLQTGQEWPSVTSQDRDFTTNEDGSVDVHFGPEQPEDGHNWIQTVPGKSWWAMFRLYGPLAPWFDKTWQLPDIERLA
ncbi:DUF1254 domain-containing protein [Rhodococcus aetherivorans]|uniref:DUF1254 domain-containing protein n=1 Tax=Rhodococcus aetherivorans TaxID=191292 RepID=UPI003692DDF1